MEKQLTFTKTDTNICKGIAVLFMVLHHTVGMYYNHFDLSWYAENSSGIFSLLVLFFSTAGKVCVSLLSLLSGYGLAKSFEKYRLNHSEKMSQVRFSLGHLFQFYSLFVVAVGVLVLCRQFSTVNPTVFGSPKSLALFLMDCFVYFLQTITFQVRADWFVYAIMIMYALFPLIYYATSKLKLFAVAILYLPWIVVQFVPLDVRLDNVIFYLYAFALGVYFEQRHTFEAIKARNNRTYKAFSFVLMLVAFGLRLLFSLPVDILFAVSIINFEIAVLSDLGQYRTIGMCGVALKIWGKSLACLGKYSADIWLIHVTLIPIIAKVFESGLKTECPIYIQYPLVLLTSLILSVLIEKLKTVTRYSVLVSKIRNRIEG